MTDMFNPRAMNVFKLRSVGECKIFIAECNHAVKQIDEQMSIPGFGDREWKEAAMKARSDIEHKREMATLRLADMEDFEKRKANAGNYEARFVRAAKSILPRDTFDEISEEALGRE